MNDFGQNRPHASDVTGPSRHLVSATGFEPRAHGCYLRQIVRSHEPGWIPVRRHVLLTASQNGCSLVLVRMNVKHKSRQVQVGQVSALGANAGIATREQVELLRKQIVPGLYSLAPGAPLRSGEYGFFLFRGYDLPAYIYDFSVE